MKRGIETFPIGSILEQSGITSEEQDGIFKSALLGALQDAFQKAQEQQRSASSNFDDLLMQKAMAVVGVAAENYSPADARLLDIVQSVGQMLAQAGCSGHDFLDTVRGRLGFPEGLLAGQSLEEKHDHHDHEAEGFPGNSRSRKKRGKKKQTKRTDKESFEPASILALLRRFGSVSVKHSFSNIDLFYPGSV